VSFAEEENVSTFAPFDSGPASASDVKWLTVTYLTSTMTAAIADTTNHFSRQLLASG